MCHRNGSCIGQLDYPHNPCLCYMGNGRQPGPITLTIPGKQHVEAKGAIVRSADNVVLSFPDYLHNFNAPAFQVLQPLYSLECAVTYLVATG